MLIDAANLPQIARDARKAEQLTGLPGSFAIGTCRRSEQRVHAFRADCEDRADYRYAPDRTTRLPFSL
jgi:hypothetical protein